MTEQESFGNFDLTKVLEFLQLFPFQPASGSAAGFGNSADTPQSITFCAQMPTILGIIAAIFLECEGNLSPDNKL